jgi:hypothetical protein
MTLSVVIISLLIGAVLAQQFKVWVLIPAFGFVSSLAAGIEIASVKPSWVILLLAVTVAVCLQLGYFFGIGIRHLLGGNRIKKAGHADFPADSPQHALR